MEVEGIELRNEFAAVRLEIDREGNSPRLRVVDLETGLDCLLDPFALQVLAWLPAKRLEEMILGVFEARDRGEVSR
jgi:hypothetical protein